MWYGSAHTFVAELRVFLHGGRVVTRRRPFQSRASEEATVAVVDLGSGVGGDRWLLEWNDDMWLPDSDTCSLHVARGQALCI
jgi:hypothetical protein